MSFSPLHPDYSRPISLAQTLHPATEQADGSYAPVAQANAFFAPEARVEAVRAGTFIGSTALGGPLNFLNLFCNPHGNGTHTECVGHIAKEGYTLDQCLTRFVFRADVLRVEGELRPAPAGFGGMDQVISLAGIQRALEHTISKPPGLSTKKNSSEALVLCTGVEAQRRNRNWSGSNPPYVAADALDWLASKGYEHLLLDLPSVDREEDGGALAGHKAWWRYPAATRLNATITEMIVLPDDVPAGCYALHLMVPRIALDAVPSQPVLYPLIR